MHGIAFSDPKSHQVKHYSSVSGVSVVAGNGTEDRVRGSAKFSSFMQPSGLCSVLDSNLFLCDSHAGDISIITGLYGACDFLLSIGEIYRSFGVHKKHHSLAPLDITSSRVRRKSYLFCRFY